jgi:uncharacterized protein YlxP (DUF503 family)
MVIGAMRLTFAIPAGGMSTKSLAHHIKDRLWAQFKIALTEIPRSSPTELVIGAALVGGDEPSTEDRMQQIIRFLNESDSVELVDQETEMIHFEEIEMERDFQKYDP